MKRVDASGTTRPIGFGKPWLQAATGRMISKEKGIAGILSTLRSPATIQEVQIQGCSLQGNPSFFPPEGPIVRELSEFTKRLNLLEFGSQVGAREYYRLLAGRSNEGITNRQLSINCLAVVKIFGIERRASSFQRSGNDQRVIDVVSDVPTRKSRSIVPSWFLPAAENKILNQEIPDRRER
jgi:hypothetical protein